MPPEGPAPALRIGRGPRRRFGALAAPRTDPRAVKRRLYARGKVSPAACRSGWQHTNGHGAGGSACSHGLAGALTKGKLPWRTSRIFGGGDTSSGHKICQSQQGILEGVKPSALGVIRLGRCAPQRGLEIGKFGGTCRKGWQGTASPGGASLPRAAAY